MKGQRMKVNNIKPQYAQANWQPFEKRPTWGYVSVQELGQVLNISPQSVHNRIGRGTLPATEKKPGFRGNKGFYQIARIRSYLESRPEDDIHWEWIHRFIPNETFERITQAQFLVKHCHTLLGVEKP